MVPQAEVGSPTEKGRAHDVFIKRACALAPCCGTMCFRGRCGQELRDWLCELADKGHQGKEAGKVVAGVGDQMGAVARPWGTCGASGC